MEQGVYIQSKSRIRGNKNKSKEDKALKIVSASYIASYKILVCFSNDKQKIIDFNPLFLKFVKGFYNKHLTPSNFKKFIVENGNIYWGENEEVIFPVSYLYSSKYSKIQLEEVLYII